MDDGRSRTAISFCPNCGLELPSSMNFCSQCGLDFRSVPGATVRDDESQRDRARGARGDADAQSVTDRDILEHRISKAMADGWELEHDFGDHAVMLQRTVGSAGMHLLIAFVTIWWTMGVGNGLYGAYRYFGDPRRVVVSANGLEGESEQSETDSSGGALFLSIIGAIYIWAVAAIVGAIALAVSPSVVGVVMFAFTALIAAAGASLLPPVRRRFRNRHSVTTNGRTRFVDERVVYDTDEPCAGCYDGVGRGVERTYRDEFCLLGIPITASEGTNVYCRQCANGETTEPADESADNRTFDTESA